MLNFYLNVTTNSGHHECLRSLRSGQFASCFPTLQQTLAPSQGQGGQKYKEMSTSTFEVDASEVYYDFTDVIEQT